MYQGRSRNFDHQPTSLSFTKPITAHHGTEDGKQRSPDTTGKLSKTPTDSHIVRLWDSTLKQAALHTLSNRTWYQIPVQVYIRAIQKLQSGRQTH